jgi:hypothetical protein
MAPTTIISHMRDQLFLGPPCKPGLPHPGVHLRVNNPTVTTATKIDVAKFCARVVN